MSFAVLVEIRRNVEVTPQSDVNILECSSTLTGKPSDHCDSDTLFESHVRLREGFGESANTSMSIFFGCCKLKGGTTWSRQV